MTQISLYWKVVAGIFIISAFLCAEPRGVLGATDLDELIKLRSQFIANGDYKEAIWASQKIIEKTPNSAAPYYMRGQAYALNRNYQSAIDDFHKALSLDRGGLGKQPKIHFEIGEAYYKWGKYIEAIKYFDETISLNPRYLGALVGRGSSYGRIGKFDLAAADFDRALQIDPKHALTYRNRAEMFFMTKEYKRTVADLNKCFDLDPEVYSRDFAAFSIRGASYHKLKMQKEALQDLEMSLNLNPYYVPALINRSYLYADLREYDLAFKDYDTALKYEPTNVDVFFYRGALHNALGQLDSALKDFFKAHELDPRNAVINLAITAVYSRQEKMEEACLWLNKAVDAANKAGYEYLDWLKSNNDFENLRKAPCYKEIM